MSVLSLNAVLLRLRGGRIMVRGLLALIFCAAVLSLNGCMRDDQSVPRPVIVPPFDGAAAYQECSAFVNLGPKPAGSPMAERAAVYLRDRLTAIGVDARIDSFADAVPGGTGIFHNVIGRIPGDTNHVIIMAAHFDTKTGISADFVGANDSGSGVGVVLGLMKALAGQSIHSSNAVGVSLVDTGGRRQATPLREERCASRPEIWAVFFDGEECRKEYGTLDGLHGSRHLARQLVANGEERRVKAFILLDMVGDRDLTVTIPRNGSAALMSAVFDAARVEGARERFFLWPGGILDDHQPFLDAGIPAVNIIDFRYGSSPGGNEYWHTPADTLDKLDVSSLEVVGRVVLRVIAGIE